MTETVPAKSIMLSAQDVRVEYTRRRWNLQRESTIAVKGVSFDLAAGQTLGIVGESGCGKSSLARAVLGFEPLAGGRVQVAGEDLTSALRRRSSALALRRRIQFVQQDPYAGFDPRMRIGAQLMEVLAIHRVGTHTDRTRQVEQVIAATKLTTEHLGRYPHNLSGGQLQRVSIARAFLLQPEVMVLDEPVSALDVSIQAQVVNLLLELQQNHGTSFLLITHDLEILPTIADRIAVMHDGQVVETGTAQQVLTAPVADYTRQLLAAAPRIGKHRKRKR